MYSRIAVVTGANKGIGLAIVRNLALQYPSSSFNNGPLLVYLTARDQQRGEEALDSLRSDVQLKKASALAEQGGLTTIKYHPLDIGQSTSVRALSDFLSAEHPDGIDIVINNAGIAMQGFDSNVVKETLQINYYGTLEATQTLLPHIRPSGRLVNVSSMAGSLTKYSPQLQAQFRSATTTADISALMEDFTAAVADGREGEKGWPSAAYAVSKAGVTGLTRAVARKEKHGQGNLAGEGKARLINACCPGWVKTEMTKGRGAKEVDDGARTPVLLALGDIGGASGQFWQDEEVKEW